MFEILADGLIDDICDEIKNIGFHLDLADLED